jgi:hypothetical protein
MGKVFISGGMHLKKEKDAVRKVMPSRVVLELDDAISGISRVPG